MVGRAPFKRGENNNNDRHADDGPITRFRGPVVPVTVDLRNADGSPRFVNGQRLISSPAAYVAPTLASPIFLSTGYNSSFIRPSSPIPYYAPNFTEWLLSTGTRFSIRRSDRAGRWSSLQTLTVSL
jgi:hypothetical protein